MSVIVPTSTFVSAIDCVVFTTISYRSPYSSTADLVAAAAAAAVTVAAVTVAFDAVVTFISMGIVLAGVISKKITTSTIGSHQVQNSTF